MTPSQDFPEIVMYRFRRMNKRGKVREERILGKRAEEWSGGKKRE